MKHASGVALAFALAACGGDKPSASVGEVVPLSGNTSQLQNGIAPGTYSLSSPQGQFPNFLTDDSGGTQLDQSKAPATVVADQALQAQTTSPLKADLATQHIRVVDDFDGDGKADIIWQDASNMVNLSKISGTAVIGCSQLGIQTDSIMGSGDFNGDGKADLVFRNMSTGAVRIALIDGSTISQWLNVGQTPIALNTKLEGIGDFDGNGRADMLWRNQTTGRSVMSYHETDGSVASWPVVSQFINPTTTTALKVGDINGDGKDDIVWRNMTTGNVVISIMDGNVPTWKTVTQSPIAPSVKLEAIGDFDDNGKADLLWRNTTTGRSVMSYHNADGSIASWPVVSNFINPATTSAVGVGDLDGDGKDDIVWRNLTSGNTVISLMNGNLPSWFTVVYCVVCNTDGLAEIAVQSADNTLVGNATIKIGDKTAQTDVNGKATITGLNLQQALVAQVTREGYINQSVRIEAQAANTTTARALVVLKPIKEVKDLPQIQLPQVIPASTLGATITIPENAFVTPNGQVATGAAKVQLTPWDITNNDMAAMPGGGVARDANGALVNLISAGMITAEFYDAQGQKLQLASGKQATIQMNLPKTSIGGNALSVGSTIPLWHFDEAQGLWLQEGNGTVVAATNTTGLAVQATVSHFSTWNWDFKWDGGSTMQVSCVKNAALVPCDVTAQITLPDGSMVTKLNSLPAAVTTIINMPNTATIKWYIMGELVDTTPVGGSVVLNMPATNTVFVRCQLPNSSFVGCWLNDGRYVPAEGATWVRSVSAGNTLALSAQSNWIQTNATTFSRYSGSVTSVLNTGDVTNVVIPLNTVENNVAQTTRLYTCDPIAQRWNGTTQTITSCVIYWQGGNLSSGSTTVAIGQFVSIPIFTGVTSVQAYSGIFNGVSNVIPHPSIPNAFVLKLIEVPAT